MDCAICLSEVNQTQGFQSACGHAFHHSCMITWLSTKNSCPVCRYPLYTYNKEQLDSEEENDDAITFIVFKHSLYKFIFTQEMEDGLLDSLEYALESMSHYEIDLFDNSSLEAVYKFTVKGTKMRLYYNVNKCPNKNIYVVELMYVKALENNSKNRNKKYMCKKQNIKYTSRHKQPSNKHYF
jgi:hypothetical protein